MKCSLESCRYNADGECCNEVAYEQCIGACEAVLGEDYKRFKEFKSKIIDAFKRSRINLYHVKIMYEAFGGGRYVVLGVNNCVSAIYPTYEEAEMCHRKLKEGTGFECPIIDLKEWEGECYDKTDNSVVVQAENGQINQNSVDNHSF